MTAAPEKTHVVKEYAHKSPLIACRFDARGRYVFASAEDRTVRRWDLATGKEAALAGHESWVFALASHPDGETIVTGGGDGQLIWWPATAEKPAPMRRRAGAPRLGAHRWRSAPTVRSSPRAATTGWSASGRSPTARRCSSCPATSCRSIGSCSLPMAAR